MNYQQLYSQEYANIKKICEEKSRLFKSYYANDREYEHLINFVAFVIDTEVVELKRLHMLAKKIAKQEHKKIVELLEQYVELTNEHASAALRRDFSRMDPLMAQIAIIEIAFDNEIKDFISSNQTIAKSFTAVHPAIPTKMLYYLALTERLSLSKSSKK